MAYSNRNALSAYTNLEQLPEILSAAFLAATLFSFGAINAITWNWFGSYTLTPEHAAYLSLGAFAIGFASSETNRFATYEQWEQALIVASPCVTLLWQYTTVVQDVLNGVGLTGTWVSVLPCAVACAGWIVAVR